MKIIKNLFLAIILSLFLFSCAGLNLKKKSASGDEFLIEKKDPLILPPDFSKLPEPNEKISQNQEGSKKIDLEGVFNNKKSNSDDSQTNITSDSGIKKSILEKIQK